MLAQNRIVQYGSVGLLVVVVLLVALGSGRKNRVVEAPISVSGGDAITPESAAALGIEGDTEGDTVRTLIAEVKQLRQESDRLVGENKTLRLNNTQLLAMENRIGRDVEADIEATGSRVAAEVDAQVQALQRKIREMEARADQIQRAQRGLGSALEGSADSAKAADMESPSAQHVVKWVQPLGGTITSGASGSEGGQAGLLGFLDTARNKADEKVAIERLTGRKSRRYGEENKPPRPFFTIPKNATLVNSTALTALVGRVPLGGQVNDPYLFKVIIGRDNLAANGIESPGVSRSGPH